MPPDDRCAVPRRSPAWTRRLSLRSSHKLLLPLLTVSLANCGKAPEESDCASAEVSPEQVGDSKWLLLSPEQRSAIARLSVEPEGPPLCTATVMGPSWAVTADHCAKATTMRIEFGSQPYDLPIREWTSHPVFDLAVIRFAAEDLPLEVTPLQPLNAASSVSLEGMFVEAAGYGVTEAGTSGELNFSVQQVLAVVDELALVLDAKGSWLGCAGDSGGPALLRDDDGQVRVVGVLSTGALDCMGEARYLYLPAFLDWLEEVGVSVGGSARSECGGLTQVGRCFDEGRPVWCEGGTIHRETCGAENVCGWDVEKAAFRCIEPEQDPCFGVSEQGRCEAGLAVRCDDGRLTEQDCLACGAQCGFSSATGLVGCR